MYRNYVEAFKLKDVQQNIGYGALFTRFSIALENYMREAEEELIGPIQITTIGDEVVIHATIKKIG
tara:strand:- start:3411 stop:3608 length:198 start_codon:yes stop_codon:yes gene_type:complete